MNAIWTLPDRRFLPLLAVGVILAGSPKDAHADMMTSRFTDRETPVAVGLAECGLTTRVDYESQRANRLQRRDAGPHNRPGALAALSLILIIPASMASVDRSDVPAPAPNQQSQQQQNQSNSGGGHTSGGPSPTPTPTPKPTPEPGTLILALTGGGTALLSCLRRRRNRLVEV